MALKQLPIILFGLLEGAPTLNVRGSPIILGLVDTHAIKDAVYPFFSAWLVVVLLDRAVQLNIVAQEGPERIAMHHSVGAVLALINTQVTLRQLLPLLWVGDGCCPSFILN